MCGSRRPGLFVRRFGGSPPTNGLREGNRAYRERFGHIFIVCAAGKSGGEMLALLERRMRNNPHDELSEAAEQQRQITRLRLAKLIDD